MGRGVNAAIEAGPVVEPSCFVSIKELPVPSDVARGGQGSCGDSVFLMPKAWAWQLLQSNFLSYLSQGTA